MALPLVLSCLSRQKSIGIPCPVNDGFETYPVDQAPPSPWQPSTVGQAWVQVKDDDKYEGAKSCRCWRTQGQGALWYLRHSFTPLTKGVWEFYFRIKSADIDVGLCLKKVVCAPTFRFRSGNIQKLVATPWYHWVTIAQYIQDTWQHLEFHFDCSVFQTEVILDDVSKGTHAFTANYSPLGILSFASDGIILDNIYLDLIKVCPE